MQTSEDQSAIGDERIRGLEAVVEDLTGRNRGLVMEDSRKEGWITHFKEQLAEATEQRDKSGMQAALWAARCGSAEHREEFLKQQLAASKEEVKGLENALRGASLRYESMTKQLAQARKALEYLADESNWDQDDDGYRLKRPGGVRQAGIFQVS